MCTDFTSINKACLKDCYPLPNIDRLVDSSVGYKVVDFLDAFRGYHQIFMAEEDVEKTAFITEYGIYCWKMMAFGLKNAGTKYQRMVKKLFSTQIGRNMEINVDDMLIKSREAEDHEPKGNRAEPEQDRRSPGYPEPQEIEGSTTHNWKSRGLDQVYIERAREVPPISSTVGPAGGRKCPAIVFGRLEVRTQHVLIKEEAKVQRSVYYVSRVMRGAETRYPRTEKLVYPLIVADRKFKPYFEAHPVEVVTD
ncbi:hypothetical protein LIER_23330 [Lithospermum erythrorhizon]|uniref:Reverse transcriptase domain-containing protein n=1 Tax=Lithospermum erythrorhizon TaxID=34254 RepID=A0AAV3R194_LITER